MVIKDFGSQDVTDQMEEGHYTNTTHQPDVMSNNQTVIVRESDGDTKHYRM